MGIPKKKSGGCESPGTQQKYMEDQHFEQVNSG